jgi:hypothetical protein
MDNHMSYLSGKQRMCLKSKQNVAIRCKSNFNLLDDGVPFSFNGGDGLAIWLYVPSATRKTYRRISTLSKSTCSRYFVQPSVHIVGSTHPKPSV